MKQQIYNIIKIINIVYEIEITHVNNKKLFIILINEVHYNKVKNELKNKN